jgi:serine protease Do
MRDSMERSFLSSLPVAVAVGLVVLLAVPPTAGEDADYGWLGVVLGNVRARTEGASDDPAPRGVPITGVVENGPAAKAGLRAQDRILAVDAVPVATARELQAAVRSLSPGQWISLTVQRGDDELDFDARLTTHPTRGEDLRVRMAWIGVEAINLPESLRKHFGAPEEAGVMISEVEEGGPADAAGVEIGDVIYEAGGVPVASSDELRRTVMAGGVDNTMEFVLARQGVEITVEALLGERPPKEE